MGLSRKGLVVGRRTVRGSGQSQRKIAQHYALSKTAAVNVLKRDGSRANQIVGESTGHLGGSEFHGQAPSLCRLRCGRHQCAQPAAQGLRGQSLVVQIPGRHIGIPSLEKCFQLLRQLAAAGQLPELMCGAVGFPGPAGPSRPDIAYTRRAAAGGACGSSRESSVRAWAAIPAAGSGRRQSRIAL